MSDLKEKIKSLFNSLRGDFPGKGKEALGWSYRKFSATKTSIYILGLMSFFYMIGTVFPQGTDLSEYVKAGGRFVFPVSVFDLLDFYSSPVFLLLALVLSLNLVICTYERYSSLFAKSYPKEFEPGYTLALTHEVKEAYGTVREVLRKELKFKAVPTDSLWTVMEKGLPYKLLTWLYHAGIIICFFGFLLTYLFAYEGTVKLLPHKLQTVIPDTTGRLKSLWMEKDPPTEFHLILDDFVTEYVQSPDLTYPGDKLSRLAIGLGWKNPAYELHEDSLFVKDWKAKIKVVKGKSTLYEWALEVNDPLEYGGYTFYLVGWEDTVKVRVDDNPILLEAKADEDLFVPGLYSPLVFSEVKTGKVLKLDGGAEELRPYSTVKRNGAGKEEDLGKMSVGDSIEINGRRINFSGFDKASVLSYRYDPGVKVLWPGGILVLLAMALRFYAGWCMAAYNIAEKDGIVYLELSIKTKGLWHSPERIIKTLEYHLTKDDIRPAPLPPEK